VILMLVLILMWPSTRQAVFGAYPLGGDHGAYVGLRETAAYLRGHAGANVTLYHRWLGTHWRYYLFQSPYDLRFWQSAKELAGYAQINIDHDPNSRQYIAFPAWQSTTLVELALAEQGLELACVFTTFKANGAPGVYLYQIQVSRD